MLAVVNQLQPGVAGWRLKPADGVASGEVRARGRLSPSEALR